MRLRSSTTTAPADETAVRICAGGVPGTKRTRVMPKGLAAEAEPANASAPKIAARRRLGRFTVQLVSARRPKSFNPSTGAGKGRPRGDPFAFRVTLLLLPACL